MAWQSIISSHPTTDPRSRLFRCGSIILLIDNLKVGGGAVSFLKVRDGRSPHTHLFLRSNKQDDCGPAVHTCKPFIAATASGKLAFGIEASPAHGDAGSDSGAARIPTSRKPAPWLPTVGTETDEVRREAVNCLGWVLGGGFRQADGTHGLPSARGMPCALRQLRLVPS